jgi:signal transduction histidine kinase
METVLLSIICIALVGLGLLTFFANTKGKTNRYFLLLTLFASLWILSNYFSNIRTDTNEVLFYNKMIFFNTSFLVYFLYLFSTVYPNQKNEISKTAKILTFIFTILTAAISLSGYLVKDISIQQSHSNITFGIGIIIYLLQFILFAFLFIWNIVKSYKVSEGVEKVKVQYLFLGISFSLIGTCITNLILPIFFSNFELSNIGPLFLLFFIIFTTVSIVRFRLFGIRFLFAQIVNTIVGTAIPYISFFLIYFIFTKFLGGVFSTLSLIIGIFFALLFSYIYSLIKDKCRKLLLGKFAYRGFDPNELITRYVKDISTELDMDKLSNNVLTLIKDIFNISNIGIIVFKGEGENIVFKKLWGYEEDQFLFNSLISVTKYWDEVKENVPILKEEISVSDDVNPKLKEIHDNMKRFDLEMILPLNKRVSLNGLIFFGKREDKKNFTAEEIQFLENIVMNTSVAIGRAILYEEVKEFNLTLQAKVEEQTEELQIKVKQLQESREKERDMIDIMGHELRTPATVVKLNAELLEGFTENIMNNKEKFKTYVSRIRNAVENEIKLINTLLSSAKLEGNKIELKLEEIDIVKEIEMAIVGHEFKAKEKGLGLVNSVLKDTPSIFADHARLIEVLNNLIDNAIKYTERGTVTIDSSFDEKMVYISVIDSGQGISEEDIANLGKKFFRVGNYLNKGEGKPDVVRPGGTGLGLYVTFGLVEKMGGKITVESKIGVGSTFTFSLPRYVGQDSGKVKSKTNNMFERLGLQR